MDQELEMPSVIALEILQPICTSLAPHPDQTVFTSCQVILPQTSLWAQIGPYIAFAGALFAFLGGLGELIEAKDKNDGAPLRLGQRVSVWSKIGLGSITIAIVASVYFTEAKAATDLDEKAHLQYLFLLVSVTSVLLAIGSVIVSKIARKRRDSLIEMDDDPVIRRHLQSSLTASAVYILGVTLVLHLVTKSTPHRRRKRR